MNDTFLYRDRNWLFEQMIIFGKTEKQLSQEFGWTKRVIEKWVQIYGFGDNNFKNLKTINSIQESLIKGSLLGDGHITEEGIFIVSHCEAQKDYLFWKYNLLKDCCKKEPTYYPSTIKTIRNQKCCIQPAYRLNTRKIIQIKNLKYLTKIDIIKNLNDLTKYRILLLEGSSHSRKVLDNNLLKYGIKLKPKFELASLDLLIEFCKKNMGIICVAKEYIGKELENKELKIINIKEKLDKRYISLVYDNEYISNAALKLKNYIKQNGAV